MRHRRPTLTRFTLTLTMLLATAPIAGAPLLAADAADEAAAAGPAAVPDQKRIEELEKRLAELEAQILSMRNARASGAPADLAELQRRLDLLAAELEKTRLGEAAAERPLEPMHGLGPAASKVYGVSKGVSFGGYGEGVYEDPGARDDSGAATGGIETFDFLRAVLYTGYKFNDRIVFNSEIEFEHANTDKGGEVAVEFAYLDFLLSKHANVRAGLVLVPAGFINELHEPPIFLGTTRPQVERRILPTTWRSNGAGVFGDAGPLTYRAYLVTGFDSEGFDAEEALREGRQEGAEEKAHDVGLAARLDWHGVPGLLLGGFYYHGDSSQGRRAPAGFTIDPNGNPLTPPTRAFDAPVTLWDLHAQYEARGWEFRALYAAGSLGDAKEVNDANGLSGEESVGSRFHGWYAQAGWDVLSLKERSRQSLTPFLRYEKLDTQSSVPGEAPLDFDASPAAQPAPFASDPANDTSVWVIGVDYKPVFNVVIKADWQDFRNDADTGVDRFSFALGYLF